MNLVCWIGHFRFVGLPFPIPFFVHPFCLVRLCLLAHLFRCPPVLLDLLCHHRVWLQHRLAGRRDCPPVRSVHQVVFRFELWEGPHSRLRHLRFPSQNDWLASHHGSRS